MENNQYIIIDNIEDLVAIREKHPQLNAVPLILLSDSFSLEQLASFNDRGYEFFDAAINDQQAKKMSNITHNILWNWFKDSQGKDLSEVNGMSFGKAFCASMEMLINAIIKYEVGLSLLLKQGDEVYFTSSIDLIFIKTIEELSKKIGFGVRPVSLHKRNNVVLYGKNKIMLDRGGRIRDLAPYFKKRFKNAILYYLLRIIRRRVRIKQPVFKRILFYPAAKCDEFVRKNRRISTINGLIWVLPLVSFRELLMSFLGDIPPFFSYCFLTTRTNNGADLKRVISRLKSNIHTAVKDISATTLISIMEEKMFKYMPAMISFFNNAVKEIESLSPDLVIVGADTSETHIIVAQAAKKAGVTTALLPHGIDCWGYKELRSGSERIIDYCFAFGNKHVMDNLSYGVARERIIVTSFPYFSIFLPPNKNSRDIYKRALLLMPDIANMSPGYKQGYFFDYINQVSRMLKNIGIEIIGLKARGDYAFLAHDMRDSSLLLDGIRIPLLCGYTNFPDVAKQADLVIGNSSTAIIEAGLMGIDYYVIYPKSNNYAHTISRTIEKIMHVSFSVDELKENILNKRVYREGYYVESFVDLKGVVDKNSLFKRFEESVCQVAHKEQSPI